MRNNRFNLDVSILYQTDDIWVQRPKNSDRNLSYRTLMVTTHEVQNMNNDTFILPRKHAAL